MCIEILAENRQFLPNSFTHWICPVSDYTLLQFAFSSVESRSIVQSKGQTILHIWPWPWKSVFKVTSQYGRFQSISDMILSCLFSVTDDTKIMVTWNTYTTEFAAKAEFFSNLEKEPHTCANSAEGWRGVERSVKQLANHNMGR